MYNKESQFCCYECSQICTASDIPGCTSGCTGSKERQRTFQSGICHDCICSEKFTNWQFWRHKQRNKLSSPCPPLHSNCSFSLKTTQQRTWIFVLCLALLLMSCQGDRLQPSPARKNSKLQDHMVPIGQVFHYKIPMSAFECEVETLMVRTCFV